MKIDKQIKKIYDKRDKAHKVLLECDIEIDELLCSLIDKYAKSTKNTKNS